MSSRNEESTFLPDDHMGALQTRWEQIQTGFVDDPRGAVRDAHGMVGEIVDNLTRTFTRERETLEEQWSKDREPDTESLRVALQRYRSFLNRLLDSKQARPALGPVVSDAARRTTGEKVGARQAGRSAPCSTGSIGSIKNSATVAAVSEAVSLRLRLRVSVDPPPLVPLTRRSPSESYSSHAARFANFQRGNRWSVISRTTSGMCLRTFRTILSKSADGGIALPYPGLARPFPRR
jgi:hypothetical protein